MKTAVIVFSCLLATSAAAQQRADVPPQVTLPGQLVNAVANYLAQGGTRTEADELVREIVAEVNAPAAAAKKEAELRKQIEAEMAAKAAKPAPAPTPETDKAK